MSLFNSISSGSVLKINWKMAQDQVDTAVLNRTVKKVPSIEALNSEMPCKMLQKERGRRMLRALLNRLRLKKCASITISHPDPSYRVAYLGNVVTGWAKGDGCVEKPLATLWRSYTQTSRPDVRMQLTVSSGGLKATTKEHGLTEYWAHRLTTCAAPAQFPRLFCWVYRHEGRRLRHELRCHAVLCASATVAQQIEEQLKQALYLALTEFKRDKMSRQNARLSLVNSVYENPSMPRRKILLSTGSTNYRPPLERSKSAPKLTSIEEIIEEEDDDVALKTKNVYRKILHHYDSTSALLDKRKTFRKLPYKPATTIVPVKEVPCDDVKDDADVGGYSEKANDNDANNNEDEDMDRKTDMILDELVQNSLRNDLLESCERAWFSVLEEIPDSDEGSLSSGCESASTVTSENDQQQQKHQQQVQQEQQQSQQAKTSNHQANDVKLNKKKTDVDFKVGGCVLARVRSIERVNVDLLKYCGYTTNHNMNSHHHCPILENEQISLIPVGESQSDFSSLKVFKKRTNDNVTFTCDENVDGVQMDVVNVDDDVDVVGESESNCSDESGYEEEDIASSVANIVLV